MVLSLSLSPPLRLFCTARCYASNRALLLIEGTSVSPAPRSISCAWFIAAAADPLLDSSCFQPSDWGQIAIDIGRAYNLYDGFVVCMGTDTMAYAASALSFMLENLGKTVSERVRGQVGCPATPASILFAASSCLPSLSASTNISVSLSASWLSLTRENRS